jgi:uncharacterized protein YlxW (UPF0749 family)
MQTDNDWHEYCDNGALNLKLIATECDLSRSAVYQNGHLKKEIKRVAIELFNNSIIDRLPYEEKASSSVSSTIKRDRSNREIGKLHEENRKLQNKVSELQAGLRDAKNKLARYEAMEAILENTGRLPR